MDRRALIKKSIHVFAFFGCLSFTLYQSHSCLMKYLSHPKGTSIVYGVSNLFPAITICSNWRKNTADPNYPYDQDVLKECQIGQETRWSR